MRSEKPVVLILHGINNSSRTPYIQYIMRHLDASGFESVCVNMRGHGSGNDLCSSRMYTARMDDDIATAVQHIQLTRQPPALYAVGFSLGANQLLCFLEHSPTANLIRAAVSVSNPFDLSQVKEHFSTGVSRLYTLVIVQPLKKLLWEGRHHVPITQENFWRAMRATSVTQFDEAVQVHEERFASVDEYYTTSSCVHHLHKIDIPLLVIHAIDDPLIPPHAFPKGKLEANPNVTMIITQNGGHIGWAAGKTPFLHNWSDKTISRWLMGKEKARMLSSAAQQQARVSGADQGDFKDESSLMKASVSLDGEYTNSRL